MTRSLGHWGILTWVVMGQWCVSAALPSAKVLRSRMVEIESVVDELGVRQKEILTRLGLRSQEVRSHLRRVAWVSTAGLAGEARGSQLALDSDAEGWSLARGRAYQGLVFKTLMGWLALKQEQADALFLEQQIFAEKAELSASLLALQPVSPTQSSSRFAQSSMPEATSAWSLRDFAARRGRLPLPILSSQVHTTGRGLDLIPEVKQAPVSAVAPGKVVYVGVMPTFGRVMIIGHGEHYFSLLGRLGVVQKQVGDAVQAGEAVAQLDAGANAVYFELREKHVALNPLQWLEASSRFKGI